MKRKLSYILSLIFLYSLFSTLHAETKLTTRVAETWDTVSSNISQKWGDVTSRMTEGWGDVKNRTSGLWNNVSQWCVEHHVADGLEAGVSIGDMGLGLDLKTPITKWVDLHAGIDWVPRFKVSMNFGLSSYVDGHSTNNFDKIAQMVYDATGIEMDSKVHMYGVGSMVNFKLLADVYPWQENRHWHITAGFYAGTSLVGKAYNAKEEKPTLVGINVYNRGYDYFTELKDIFNVPLGNNTYMDPDMVEKIQEKFRKYGRLGVHIGDFKDGTPYLMEPAPDGTVSAKAYINHFKPYLGAGYSTNLDQEGRWKLGVDLGMLIWGGVPDVINHDYTTGKDINFTKELIKVRGKVGRYVRIIKSFPVYPVVTVRFSYTIL